jgi:hypothetical protein
MSEAGLQYLEFLVEKAQNCVTCVVTSIIRYIANFGLVRIAVHSLLSCSSKRLDTMV